MLNINHFQNNGVKMLKNQQKLTHKTQYKARGCIFLMLCILLVVGIMPLVSAEITNGLIAYYSFDETSGLNLPDDTGNYSDALLENMVGDEWEAGILRNALRFDGSTDSVQAKDIITPIGAKSISVWFKPDSNHTVTAGRILGNAFISTSNGLLMDFSGGNLTIRLHYASPGNQLFQLKAENINFFDGDWHNVILTWDGTTGGDKARLYIDGISIVNTTSTGTESNTPSNNFTIGARPNGASRDLFFDGLIDEILISNNEFNKTQIDEIYNGGDGFNPLKPFWTLSVDLITPLNGSFYSDIGTNFTANYTIFKANLTNATYYVWKDDILFNSTTVDITGDVSNSTILYINNFTLNDYKWNVYACGINATATLCEWGDSNFTFNVGASIVNETYSNETYETSEEYFEVTVELLSGVILYDSNFIYNEIMYDADYVSLGGSLYKIFTTFNVPSVDSSTVFDFFWQLSYLSDVIITQNLTARQQTVIPIADLVITNNTCDAGFSEAIHYDFFDEKNLTDLNYIDVKYNFQYGYGNLTSNLLYGNIEGISDLRICINSTFNNYLIGYGEVEYSDENHSLRRHYLFEKRILSNTTTSNISLYSLYKSISTSFLVEIRTPTLSPYVNKYTSLLRWYPSLNKYNVVEMGKTDDKGQTVSKVESEDADYRIGVYELNGTLIYLASPIRMVCIQSPCTYILNVPDEEDISYTNFLGLEFTEITYSNGVFYFQYNDPSQSTESISLSVYKVTGSYKSLICTDNSTSFTDLLICNVSSYSGNLFAVVYRTASPLRTFLNKWVNAGTTVFTSSAGLFITMLIFITLILLGSVSPVIAIVFGIFALIPALVLKTITYPILISIAIIGGIVIHFMRKS